MTYRDMIPLHLTSANLNQKQKVVLIRIESHYNDVLIGKSGLHHITYMTYMIDHKSFGHF